MGLCRFPWWLSGKESACQYRRCRFNPWKILWRRKWQPTPVFLPGKSHAQRSLSGYSSWSHKRIRHNWATKQQQTLCRPKFIVKKHFCFISENKYDYLPTTVNVCSELVKLVFCALVSFWVLKKGESSHDTI